MITKFIKYFILEVLWIRLLTYQTGFVNWFQSYNAAYQVLCISQINNKLGIVNGTGTSLSFKVKYPM